MPGELRRRSMATVGLTSENFEAMTGGEGLALIDFWAS